MLLLTTIVQCTSALVTVQVSAHWHKGSTFMVKFEEEVIARDKASE